MTAKNPNCFFYVNREDRRDFIKKKYIERKFCAPLEDTIDSELSAVMESRPGDGEADLLNDSVEVRKGPRLDIK